MGQVCGFVPKGSKEGRAVYLACSIMYHFLIHMYRPTVMYTQCGYFVLPLIKDGIKLGCL